MKCHHASARSHLLAFASFGCGRVADPLHYRPRMVVPLILLGTVTKLAFAVVVTHRTRVWWLPGVVAVALGIAASWTGRVPETASEGAVVLGCCAFVIAYLAGVTARSSRTAPVARSSRRVAR